MAGEREGGKQQWEMGSERLGETPKEVSHCQDLDSYSE